MSDQLFNVIFRGEIVAGHNLPDVKARFAQLFKTDIAKVEAFFAGKPVVLKANCDRATGDKFYAVLQQAGAVVEVHPVAPQVAAPIAPPPKPAAPAATVAAGPAASAPAATPAPKAAPSAAAPAPAPADPWSLAASGSNLVRPDEIVQAEPVKVDISQISVVKRNPFSTDAEEPLEAERKAAPPALDLSSLSLAAAGEALADYEEFVPREINLSELSMDAPGAEILRTDERQEFVPVNVDTSGMDVAPAGGDLGQIQPPPAPPAPSTDHLSVQK